MFSQLAIALSITKGGEMGDSLLVRALCGHKLFCNDCLGSLLLP